MKSNTASDAWNLVFFFLLLIGIGTALLLLPGLALRNKSTLSFVDALFTITSAVCVTGLVTVDTSRFSLYGQLVILLFIQLGGLGIITFTSIQMIIPGARLPLRRLNTVKSYFIEGVEYRPERILKTILLYTLVIESGGAFFLALLFRAAGEKNWMYAGIFHAISAFCNAGFSLFPDSLTRFRNNPFILGVVMFLIISGGLGFIVLQDIMQRLKGKKRYLSYHSKVVLGMTLLFIAGGTGLFYLLEYPRGITLLEALFQSITPRTAGFDARPQVMYSTPSKILTIFYMFIGAGPGSIAGGIKLTTVFVIALLIGRKPDSQGDIIFRHHRIPANTLHNAMTYFLKALLLLMANILLLSIIEGPRGLDFDGIVFEVVSAFGTVGLSLGITSQLSDMGKLVIICTMFAGRLGLVAMAFPKRKQKEYPISYPLGQVLLG